MVVTCSERGNRSRGWPSAPESRTLDPGDGAAIMIDANATTRITRQVRMRHSTLRDGYAARRLRRWRLRCVAATLLAGRLIDRARAIVTRRSPGRTRDDR